IAEQFLVPRQLKDHGLSVEKITFEAETIRVIIESYTREAGVRSLEREIASICRKVARRVVKEGPTLQVVVTPGMVFELLGKAKFRSRRKNEESEVGVATGLAWTEVGGELME